MPTSSLRFCFDFISPYAYLAWSQLPALAKRHGRAVEPWPVLFAGVLDTLGTKGPAEIPPRRIYVFKDAFRSARKLGLPFGPPPSHPFNPLLALRVASLPMEESKRQALIDGLFAAVWGGGGPGVSDPSVVTRIAGEAGLDGARVVQEAGLPESKDRVRRQTDAALAAGAFGVPTVLADGEPFFGFDSFPHLETFLRGEDPLDLVALEKWRALPASAERKPRA